MSEDKKDPVIPHRRRTADAWMGIAIVMPMVVFLAVFFFAPLLMMMSQSFYDPEPGRLMPQTASAMADWDAGQGLPGDEIVSTFSRELVAALDARRIGKLGSRMDDRVRGASSLLRRAAVKLKDTPDVSPRETLASISPAWNETPIWTTLKASLSTVTLDKYLGAVDMRLNQAGEIEAIDKGAFVNLRIFWRTIFVSAAVCLICLVLGYPVAYLMTQVSPATAGLCMMAILIPYWTPALVRTTGWIAILQGEGLLNSLLRASGILAEGQRLALIFNMTGTLIVMVHVLLPIMILPLFSSMRGISPTYLKAAVSLGAHPVYAFASVFVPLTRLGIAAGVTVVFMLSVGFYVTPALVGGAQGTFISNIIAFHMDTSLNWGLAAAISNLLFVLVVILYVVYARNFSGTGRRFP